MKNFSASSLYSFREGNWISSRSLSYRLYFSISFFLLVLLSLFLDQSSLGIFVLALVDICFCGDVLFRLALKDISHGRITWPVLMTGCISCGFIYSVGHTFSWPSFQGPCAGIYLYSMLLISCALWVQRYCAREHERTPVLTQKMKNFMPKSARVRKGNSYKKIFAQEVKIGDELLVQAGERIAADGILVQGEGAIDEQLITGNILPTLKREGSCVYAGTLCKTGPLHVRVTGVIASSVLMEIIHAISQSEERKMNFPAYLNRASWGFFVIFLIICAGLYVGKMYISPQSFFPLSLLLFLGGVVCPAVLPLAYMMPVCFMKWGGQRNRIYIQNLHILSVLPQADVFFFDKTGTLTHGELTVSNLFPQGATTPHLLITALATAEQSVSGPFSAAVLSYARQNEIFPQSASYFEVFAGQGVTALSKNARIVAGSVPWLKAQGFHKLPAVPPEACTVIGVAKDKAFLGYVTLEDKIRPFVRKTLDFLREQGKEIWLVSGDNERSVSAVAKSVHIEKYNFEVLPSTKAEIITNLRDTGKKVVMVGDGFNDMLALLKADGAIVLGSGKNVYNPWVDVIIKRNDLYPLVFLFKIKKKLMYTLWQNVSLCVGLNGAMAGWMLFQAPLSVKWYTLLGANLAILGLILLNSIRMLRIK